MRVRTRNLLLGMVGVLFLISNSFLLITNLRMRRSLSDAENTIFRLQSSALNGDLASSDTIERLQLKLYNRPPLAGLWNDDDSGVMTVSQVAHNRKQQDGKALEIQNTEHLEHTQSQARRAVEEYAAKAAKAKEEHTAKAVKSLESVPTLSLLDLKNRYLGKNSDAEFTLFIFFSPTDCPLCLQEAAIWQRLHLDGQRLGLSVVGVIDRSSSDEVSHFLKQLGITFPVLFDNKSLLTTLYKVMRTPYKVLIDSKGSTVLISPASITLEQQREFERSLLKRLAGGSSR